MHIVVPLIIVSFLIFSGCTPAAAPVDSSDTTGAVIIHMPATGFDPAKLTIKQGTKVCYVNDDPEARWPASNIHPTHEIYSDFDSKTPVRSGDTWCFTFTKSGIWQFHDHLYSEFVGTVTVE